MKYHIIVRENDTQLEDRAIPDPFIHATIWVRGVRSALRCLFGGLRLVVQVDGDDEAIRHVMTPPRSVLVDGPMGAE